MPTSHKFNLPKNIQTLINNWCEGNLQQIASPSLQASIKSLLHKTNDAELTPDMIPHKLGHKIPLGVYKDTFSQCGQMLKEVQNQALINCFQVLEQEIFYLIYCCLGLIAPRAREQLEQHKPRLQAEQLYFDLLTELNKQAEVVWNEIIAKNQSDIVDFEPVIHEIVALIKEQRRQSVKTVKFLTDNTAPASRDRSARRARILPAIELSEEVPNEILQHHRKLAQEQKFQNFFLYSFWQLFFNNTGARQGLLFSAEAVTNDLVRNNLVVNGISIMHLFETIFETNDSHTFEAKAGNILIKDNIENECLQDVILQCLHQNSLTKYKQMIPYQISTLFQHQNIEIVPQFKQLLSEVYQIGPRELLFIDKTSCASYYSICKKTSVIKEKHTFSEPVQIKFSFELHVVDVPKKGEESVKIEELVKIENIAIEFSPDLIVNLNGLNIKFSKMFLKAWKKSHQEIIEERYKLLPQEYQPALKPALVYKQEQQNNIDDVKKAVENLLLAWRDNYRMNLGRTLNGRNFLTEFDQNLQCFKEENYTLRGLLLKLQNIFQSAKQSMLDKLEIFIKPISLYNVPFNSEFYSFAAVENAAYYLIYRQIGLVAPWIIEFLDEVDAIFGLTKEIVTPDARRAEDCCRQIVKKCVAEIKSHMPALQSIRDDFSEFGETQPSHETLTAFFHTGIQKLLKHIQAFFGNQVFMTKKKAVMLLQTQYEKEVNVAINTYLEKKETLFNKAMVFPIQQAGYKRESVIFFKTTLLIDTVLDLMNEAKSSYDNPAVWGQFYIDNISPQAIYAVFLENEKTAKEALRMTFLQTYIRYFISDPILIQGISNFLSTGGFKKYLYLLRDISSEHDYPLTIENEGSPYFYPIKNPAIESLWVLQRVSCKVGSVATTLTIALEFHRNSNNAIWVRNSQMFIKDDPVLPNQKKFSIYWNSLTEAIIKWQSEKSTLKLRTAAAPILVAGLYKKLTNYIASRASNDPSVAYAFRCYREISRIWNKPGSCGELERLGLYKDYFQNAVHETESRVKSSNLLVVPESNLNPLLKKIYNSLFNVLFFRNYIEEETEYEDKDLMLALYNSYPYIAFVILPYKFFTSPEAVNQVPNIMLRKLITDFFASLEPAAEDIKIYFHHLCYQMVTYATFIYNQPKDIILWLSCVDGIINSITANIDAGTPEKTQQVKLLCNGFKSLCNTLKQMSYSFADATEMVSSLREKLNLQVEILLKIYRPLAWEFMIELYGSKQCAEGISHNICKNYASLAVTNQSIYQDIFRATQVMINGKHFHFQVYGYTGEKEPKNYIDSVIQNSIDFPPGREFIRYLHQSGLVAIYQTMLLMYYNQYPTFGTFIPRQPDIYYTKVITLPNNRLVLINVLFFSKMLRLLPEGDGIEYSKLIGKSVIAVSEWQWEGFPAKWNLKDLFHLFPDDGKINLPFDYPIRNVPVESENKVQFSKWFFECFTVGMKLACNEFKSSNK